MTEDDRFPIEQSKVDVCIAEEGLSEMEVRVILNGPGRVGMSFVRLLLEKADYIRDRTGFRPVLAAVVGRDGSLCSATGLTLSQVQIWKGVAAASMGSGVSGADLRPPRDGSLYLPSGSYSEVLVNATLSGEPGIVVEATPTDIFGGQPGLDHLTTAMEMGFSAITLAKGPLVVSFGRLMSLAASKGVSLKYSGAVAAALPTLDTALYSMAGADILEIEGVLNGTTNYILNSMALGESYGQALSEAQAMGVAEADPTLDVEGFDTAAKLLILANTIWGYGLALSDAHREGITELSGEQVRQAARAGTPVRLLATARRTEAGAARLSVRPSPVPAGHPFQALPGTSKAVRFASRQMGDVIVSGGASDVVGAAASALKDLIHIIEERFRRHPPL